MTEQLGMDGLGVPIEEAQRDRKTNPLLAVYGPGPEDATCRSCVHLYALPGYAGHYLKCDLRKLTHGAGSDHRAGWPACGRYEEGRVL